VAQEVVSYSLEIGNFRMLADARAFQAWLVLRQGGLAEAQRWAESVDPRTPLVPLTSFVFAPIVLAQVLIRQGTPTCLADASELLSRLAAFAESQHSTHRLVEVYALQALLYSKQGDEAAALRVLTKAVSQAQPGGLVRVFVDLGPDLGELLAPLRMEGTVAGFVERIIQAMSPVPARGTDGAAPRVSPKTRQPGLVEPLTDRELEVLAGLAQRQSAKEIAQHLIISDRTVKRHTANIYQKLSVNCRRDAVATALELGLLPQT
jgi:LuxR family maltose regulon positive regulatory protein